MNIESTIKVVVASLKVQYRDVQSGRSGGHETRRGNALLRHLNVSNVPNIWPPLFAYS